MSHEFPVSFHNVAELEPAKTGLTGTVLRRFPSSVRFDPSLSAVGRNATAHSSNGCEIRFVAPGSMSRIYLATTYDKARVFALRGEYTLKEGVIELEGGRVNTVNLEHGGFDGARPDAFAHDRFSPNLWRIYCLDAPIIFCGVEAGAGPVRPPTADEIPARRWLAYGSSITQAGSVYVNYLNTAAQLLGVDAYNLGMGGSCFLEPSIAQFIASRSDWDFATFELGVNVLNAFTPDEFRKRARHFVETVATAHPDKPVVLLTIFRFGADYAKDQETAWAQNTRAFREIVGNIASELKVPNVHVLDGREIFTDLMGFQADLVHPMPLAFVRAGMRLAEMLRPIVG